VYVCSAVAFVVERLLALEFFLIVVQVPGPCVRECPVILVCGPLVACAWGGEFLWHVCDVVGSS
jgi:hypothetical protein